EARNEGITKPLQGNLDPSLLLADWDTIEERAKKIIDEGRQHPAHIFNLGHGVTPDIKPETLKRLTQLIHDYSKKS
ncbi:uroporphyrinogen decarboxylase family protein, partial [Halobacillus trueperi]